MGMHSRITHGCRRLSLLPQAVIGAPYREVLSLGPLPGPSVRGRNYQPEFEAI
jgi:hypothetical protein